MSREDMGKEVVGGEDNDRKESELRKLCFEIKDLDDDAFNLVCEQFLLLADNRILKLAEIVIENVKGLKGKSIT